MATLRRHWRETAAIAAVVVMVLAWALWRTASPALAQGEGPDPLTRAQYDRLLNVLADVDLDRDALVALNLSETQADDILSAARSWWELTDSTLGTLQDTIADKKHAVYVLEKAIALGPADPLHPAQLATARAELATAEAAYDTGLAGLRTAVTAELSASQQTTWTAIASGHGQRMPLRMLDLNDTQRVDLGRAWRHYRWRQGAARSAQERTAAVSAWETDLASILTAGQQTIVDSYHTNFVSASEAVSNAMDAQLPVEDS